MIKTKEKICLFVLSLGFMLLFCFSLMGCGSPTSFCYFVSEDEIILMKNSNLNTKNIKIESNVQYDISWDENIIDYNSETGEITAKNEGKTKITISYLKNNKTYKQSITVSVIEPVFATDIELENHYVYYVGAAETFSCDVLTLGGEYNLNLVCESLDPLCFQTSKNVILPQKTGEATMIVKAICGYDQTRNEFLYIQKETYVYVLETVKALDISLCDYNKTPLESAQVYNLLPNDNENLIGLAPDYYIKLESNEDISHYKIAKADNTQLWNFLVSETYPVEIDEHCIFVPITISGSAEDDIRVQLLRQENKNVFSSAALRVHTYKYLKESDLKIYATNVGKTKQEIAGNIDNSFVKLLPNSQNGKYALYKISNNSTYFNLAISNKKYFYGIICFDNFDINCYNEINAEPSNLKIEKLTSNRFYFEVMQSGDASVIFSTTALNGKVFTKTFMFDVQTVEATSYEKEENTTITLLVGEEKDFALFNIEPAYAVVETSIELQNNNGVVSLDGTKVVAQTIGQEIVVLNIDGVLFQYTIVVVQEDNIEIQIVEQTHNTSYFLILQVSGTYDALHAEVVGDDGADVIVVNNQITIETNALFTTVNVIVEKGGEEIITPYQVNWNNT